MTEVSDIVERLRELAGWSFNQYGDQGYIEEFMEAADEIEKLRKDLSLSVFADSEYCKVLEREVERLLKSRNRWADKYNKLLVKHRAALEGK